MLLTDHPAVADRMLLLDEVRFDPDLIFALEHPIFLMPGDQVSLSGEQLVVSRVDGSEERPAGELSRWCWRWRLL